MGMGIRTALTAAAAARLDTDHARGLDRAVSVGARTLSDLAGAAGALTRGRERAIRPEDWERALVALRYAAWDAAPGPVRTAALDDYVRRVHSARRVVGARPGRGDRARVAATLRLERRLLGGVRLATAERRRATVALTRSLLDVEGRPLP